MPIVDVSGLTKNELSEKSLIRRGIKRCLANHLSIHEDTVTVTFITDDTTDKHEHVMARLYSKKFMGMEALKLDAICDNVVEVLEIAKHPYNEAFPIPVMAMRGRALKQTV